MAVTKLFVLLDFRRFFKDMQQNALDKKSNIEYLEKEVGLKRFLPRSITDSMKVSLELYSLSGADDQTSHL